MKTTTTQQSKKEVAGKDITFYEGVTLNTLLSRAGYNTKDLSTDNFLNLHYLKLKLKKKLNEVNEAVELLAKEMKHEAIPFGNGMQYRKVKDDGSTVQATKEFIERKTQLEDMKISGLKLNFMNTEDFRSWAGNIDGQFDLSEHLLSVTPVEQN